MVGVVLGAGDSNLLAEKKMVSVPPPWVLFSCDIVRDQGVEIREVFSVQEAGLSRGQVGLRFQHS